MGTREVNSDLLLQWMSQVGSGSIRDLRQKVAWVARNADRNPKPYETGRWLRDISALGHAEVDWSTDSWAIGPPVATLLPASGGTAVIAGSRSADLEKKLETALFVHRHTVPFDNLQPLPSPTAVFLQADSIAELRESVESAEMHYVGCTARTIARGLTQISLGAEAAPPARSDPIEHFSFNGASAAFVPGEPPDRGLCRTSIYGRVAYRYLLDGKWYETDHATGILLEQARRGVSVIRFRPERIAASEKIGTVFVDQGAALPPLQARALVLCTGLPAQFSQKAETAIYRNVPIDIADMVAKSIRQQLALSTTATAEVR